MPALGAWHDALDPDLFEDEGGSAASNASSSEDTGSAYSPDEELDERNDTPKQDKGKGRADEDQIDDGLSRLISSVFRKGQGNLLDPNAASGVLSENWDRSMQDVMDDIEAENARGSSRRKKRRVASASAHLSPEIQHMLSEANALYMSRDHSNAIDLLQEIIRLEPTARPAYHTLSAIHTELGNDETVLQLDILAAHLSLGSDANATWKDLSARSKDRGLYQQAIYCLSRAISADKEDVDALWDRSELYAQVGNARQASLGFLALLKRFPNDPHIIRSLVPLLVGTEETDQALRILHDLLENQRRLFPDGPPNTDDDCLRLSDISDLVELARSERRFKDAINYVKIGQRWLQGRGRSGQIWDLFTDDREFDPVRKQRPNWEANERVRWMEDQPVYELPTSLRASLAICRLNLNNREEADRHTDLIRERTDVSDNPEVYGDLADAYLSKRLYDKASELYYDMAECDLTNGPAVWMKVAQCGRALGQYQAAAECLEAVVESDPSDLATKLQLAEVYEEMDDRSRALTLVNEVLEARRLLRLQSNDNADVSMTSSQPAMDSSSLFIETQLDPSRKSFTKRKGESMSERRRKEELRQSEIAAAYQKLQFLQNGADGEHSREWLETASYLIDSFRETPALFPSDGKTKYKGIVGRQMKKKRARGETDLDADATSMALRMELALSDGEEDSSAPPQKFQDHFCGINFDDWLTLAMKYAFALVRNREYEEADEVLRHLTTAAVFRQNSERKQSLIFALASCALQVNEPGRCAAEIRKIIWANAHLDTQTVRIMSALFSQGEIGAMGYADVNLQKYMLRCIKTIDGAARNAGHASPALDGSSKQQSKGKERERRTNTDEMGDVDVMEDEESIASKDATLDPTKPNPYFLLFYATVLLCNKSYQSSIGYFLRAFEAHSRDPLILLAFGVAYLHRAMQRQTDNRHHQIAQGFTLLSLYRKARGNCMEVEFNFGRAFHFLGITSLAIKHYRAALAFESEKQQSKDKVSSLARYAAYNLYLIYMMSDLGELARRVLLEWIRW